MSSLSKARYKNQDTMSVYQVTVEDGFQELHYEKEEDRNEFMSQHPGPFLTGESHLHDWDPPEMFNGIKSAKKGEFVLFTIGCLTCTSAASQKYGHIFERYGELLKFAVKGFDEPLWVFNNTNRIDALDLEKSKKHPDANWWITEYHFKPEVISKPMIFRIPIAPGRVYVATNPSAPSDEDFYQLYHSTGGSGLRWNHVWTQS